MTLASRLTKISGGGAGGGAVVGSRNLQEDVASLHRPFDIAYYSVAYELTFFARSLCPTGKHGVEKRDEQGTGSILRIASSASHSQYYCSTLECMTYQKNGFSAGFHQGIMTLQLFPVGSDKVNIIPLYLFVAFPQSHTTSLNVLLV